MKTLTALKSGAAAAGLAFVLWIPVQGETVGARFLASLRIAKPKAVVAAAPGTGVGIAARQIQNTIAGILAETTSVAVDEPDVAAANRAAAAAAAGFPVRTISARSDSASFEVLGAHRVELHIRRAQLQTLLAEAGRANDVAASVDGAPVSLERGHGVRLQYGHCPAPVAATIQNQIQGPPPPSTDNGNCVILTEVPLTRVTVPAALDTVAVMEIALELSGMSPNQARDFRTLFGWPASLSLSLPRGVRSYEIVNVDGVRGMQIITAGRREPAYALMWTRDGIVYTLAGYGSSGDAIPLAASLR